MNVINILKIIIKLFTIVIYDNSKFSKKVNFPQKQNKSAECKKHIKQHSKTDKSKNYNMQKN